MNLLIKINKKTTYAVIILIMMNLYSSTLQAYNHGQYNDIYQGDGNFRSFPLLPIDPLVILIPAFYTSIAVLGGSSVVAKIFSSCKHQPQFRYVTRPIYELFGGSSCVLVSVPASFFFTDLILHQYVPIQILLNFLNHGTDISKYEIDISWKRNFSWIFVSFFVVHSHLTRPTR